MSANYPIARIQMVPRAVPHGAKVLQFLTDKNSLGVLFLPS